MNDIDWVGGGGGIMDMGTHRLATNTENGRIDARQDVDN